MGAGESERRQAGHNAAHRETSLPIHPYTLTVLLIRFGSDPELFGQVVYEIIVSDPNPYLTFLTCKKIYIICAHFLQTPLEHFIEKKKSSCSCRKHNKKSGFFLNRTQLHLLREDEHHCRFWRHSTRCGQI